METHRRPNARIFDSTAWASALRLRKLSTTSAPAVASEHAMASPIPRLPPVTSALFPLRSSIPSMVHGEIRSLHLQHRAGSGVCRKISEDELNRTQHHLRQGWSFKERGCVSHGAIEDTALAVALDPNQPVILIRPDVPVAEVCLLRIDADQDVQFVTRVGAIGEEVIKLIGVNETLSTQVRSKGTAGKLLRQRAVGVVDLQRGLLDMMRATLCADQFAELRHVHRRVTGAVKTRESAALMHKANQAVQHL